MLKRLFGRADPREALESLYTALVAEARDPAWYAQAEVADTIDGRFDMVTAMVALALARLERERGDDAVMLTELFIEDMDGQLRQLGFGDLVVGKHVGKMMGALGGRLGAYRGAMAGNEPLEDALVRNLYRGVAPNPDALAFAATRFRRRADAIASLPLDALMAGRLA